MKTKRLLWALLLAYPTLSWAQTSLQVVTKTIEKNVAWKPGLTLEIISEKADVEVRPGPGNNIAVKAELSAKHPSLDTARADLDAWRWVVSKVGKTIYMRAYLGLGAGKTMPRSNMKARIFITAPENCPVNLSNKYGKAALERLNAPVALTGEFCSFSLTQLGGPVQINSLYGNITGSGFKDKVAITCKRADVDLNGLNADCVVRAEYGNVHMSAAAQSGNLWVKGEKSNVTLSLSDPVGHNVYLTAAYGVVQAPDRYLKSSPSAHVKKAMLAPSEGRPIVTVETNFGNITIE